MLIFQQIVLALNALLALVFGLDTLFLSRLRLPPRTQARVGLLLIILFMTFLLALLLFAVAGAALRGNAAYLALLLYVALPFAIGQCATYRTRLLYATLQLLALLASAATLYVI